MLQTLSKKSFVFVCILLISFSNVDLSVWGEVSTRVGSMIRQRNIVDKMYLARTNTKVVDNFKGGVIHAEAAQSASSLQYTAAVGPVSGSTSANYVYASFFNPSGSGKYAVIKHIAIRGNAVTAANYVNLTVRRITAAGSGGVLMQPAEIPKKNTSSVDPVLQVRYAGPTVTLAGTVDSRILGQPMAGAAGDITSNRDITFGASDEKIVLAAGEGIAVYQEAAGDADHRIYATIEWEEQVSAPTALDEFLFAFPRVENAAAINYTYNSFFNPAASGKTAIVKRIWFGSESCDGAAVYTNNIVLRRTSSASAGTQVLASNVPEKNNAGATSVMEFRHTNVTVSTSTFGGADARIANVTPCGAAGQAIGWQMIDFQSQDEDLILQAGQGIALMSDAAGNANQIVRMIVEWQEVTSGNTPATQNEYMWASSRVEVAAALNTTFYTFFNPATSTKTISIKRLTIRVNADTAATYSNVQFRRLSAAPTTGTLINRNDISKKHTGSSTSTVDIRWCGAACATAITATYAGTTDSDILSVVAPGAVGQLSGQRDIIFNGMEDLVIKPGQGIGLYLDRVAGDIDHYIKIGLEWDEESSGPSAGNEFMVDISPVAGVASNPYTYGTLFNPAASGKRAIIKHISIRTDAIGAAAFLPLQVRRITAASSGTQITAANMVMKNASSTSSVMEVRRSGVTTTYAGGSDSKLIGLYTPNAVGSAVAPSTNTYFEYYFENDEDIVLAPGEGIGVYTDTANGNTNHLVDIILQWEETASVPSVVGDFLLTTGPSVSTSTTSFAYTLSSFFNPATSTKDFIVKRIGITANRSGTQVAPGSVTVSLKRISDAWGGTTLATANMPKKNNSTSASDGLVRYGGGYVLAAASTSRILSTIGPTAINMVTGQTRSEIVPGDELVLRPGEGLALVQETQSGDVLTQYHATYEWAEATYTGAVKLTQAAYRFFTNNNSSSVTTTLAATSTPATLTAAGQAFRLRLAVAVASSSLQKGEMFRLQYVDKGSGSCSAPSGGTPSGWTNVTNKTSVAFLDNALANDGVLYVASSSDPTDGARTMLPQTYNETGAFSNASSTIYDGQDGLFDFVLYDKDASPSTTFCFRAVKAARYLYLAGSNSQGHQADGTTNNVTTFRQLGSSSNWKSATFKSGVNYALRGDGTLWAWGDNASGQLGQGNVLDPVYTIVQVGTSSDWISMSKGFSYLLAIKNNNTLWSLGANSQGDGGVATTTNPVTSLTQIGSATNWKLAARGFENSFAIKTDGTLWGWGGNAYLQLGSTTAATTSTPLQIGASTWKDITTGGGSRSETTIGIRSDGTLWAWGGNTDGLFGAGASSTATTATAAQIGVDTDWEYVSAGNNHVVGFKSNGTLWAWGSNAFGAIGTGASSTSIMVPTQLGTSTDWLDVSGTTSGGYALKPNGDMWFWGFNSSGMRGNGTTNNIAALEKVTTGLFVADIFGGSATGGFIAEATSTFDTYAVYPEITTYGGQSLSFSISTTTVYFGTLSTAQTKYASSTSTSGSTSEVEAHTVTVTTSASSGYSLTLRGASLTSAANSNHTIAPLGSNTAPSIGSEQFGIRAVATGGNGTVVSPFAASGFAFTSTATTSSQLGQSASGNGVSTVYSVRMMSNIAPTTEAANYSTSLVYVVTANF